MIVAAPAGFIIWILANVTAGDATLLSHCAAFLDPFGKLFLDGTILFAFILGFPANEIVSTDYDYDLYGNRDINRNRRFNGTERIIGGK